MNDDLLKGIPPEERALAEQLQSIAGKMEPGHAFQAGLERRLRGARRGEAGTAARSAAPAAGRASPSLAWAVLAAAALLVIAWAANTLLPARPEGGAAPPPVSTATPAAAPAQAATQPPATAAQQAAPACKGRLAAGRGFSVFLTGKGQTDLAELDAEKAIGELRLFAWSPGGRLAVAGNTRGSGNLYVLNEERDRLEPVLSNSELGYLAGVSWSWDGEQLLTWELSRNNRVYLVGADGSGPVEKELPVKMFETPQFAPDGKILVYGADADSYGLFRVRLDTLQAQKVSALVEHEGSFALSPDGSMLAYVEMDRDLGEARMVVESEGGQLVIGTLPIPKGAGAAAPTAGNLSWSPDGKTLAFDFGRTIADRSVYLAHIANEQPVKFAGPAHAPAISPDGKCLAYIQGGQVFVVDLSGYSSNSPAPATPVLFAELPRGRGPADNRMDRLQWQPGNFPAMK